jgi:hypothetical protein
MRPLRIGIKAAPRDATYYEDLLAIWQEADGVPVFEHAWLVDYFAPIDGHLTAPASKAGPSSPPTPPAPPACASG